MLKPGLAEDIKDLWNVYTEYAREVGKSKEKPNLQEGYSLWWFFAYQAGRVNFPQCLPPLAHAFFADPEDRPELLKRCAAAPKRLPPATPGKEDYIGAFAPNRRQWQAIRTALVSPISFIQGPPGTGKTDTILNLLYQIDRLGLHAAVVSSNGAALDNIHDKLAKMKENGGADRGLADRVARLGSADSRKKFSKAQSKIEFHSEGRWYCRTGPDGRCKSVKPVGEQEKWLAAHPEGILKPAQWEDTLKAKEFFDAGFVAFTSTAHSLPACFRDGLFYQYDYVIVDETSQMDDLTGIIALCHAKHLVLVGDEKQLPPVLKPENMAVLENYGISDEEIEALLSREEQEEADRLAYKTTPEFFEDYDASSRRDLEDEARWQRKLGEYAPQCDVSFFDLCMKVFEPSEPESGKDILPQTSYKVFLNEHYRCHPGIIEFCNQEVYGGRLQIKSKMENGVPLESIPIKILYYEGDYCQRWMDLRAKGGADGQEDGSLAPLGDIARCDWHYRLPPKKRPTHSSKHNAKQVEIFMEEEWEELSRRMEEDEALSVCILSPFNGQLEAIRHAIEQRSTDASVTGGNLYSAPKQTKVDALFITWKRGDKTAPGTSTVNKAQGKEFDIVYLLPAEDGDWEGSFSQKRRMVNVAVSRAKRELRIITSTKYMSTELQKALKLKTQRPAGEEAVDEGEHYLRRLADYVWKHQRENGAWDRGAEFGFHKAALTSIFDDKELVAEEDKLLAEQEKPSAGQRRVGKVLVGLIRDKGITLKPEVPIRDVLKQLGREEMKGVPKSHGESFRTYVEAGASFDFVLYQDGRPFLAVEVDGAYHRFPLIKKMSPEEKDKSVEGRYQDFRKRWLLDREKDALVREVIGGWVFQGNTKRYVDEWHTDESGAEYKTKKDQWEGAAGDFALLRLPDDGTTYLETDELRAAAPEALAEKVFTLEELIARYRSAAPAPEEMVSLSSAISTWTSQEEQERLLAGLGGKGASKVQPRLEKMGLLEHTPEGWRPTPAGKGLGIKERAGKKDDGAGYFYPVYSPAVWERVKKRLLDEIGA